MAALARRGHRGGVRIGPYELLDELGHGAMGAVFRVRVPSGEEAALKVLVRVDAKGSARFEREKRLLASLSEADGFVPLLDAGSSPAGTWLLMPLVPGGTLRQRLRAGPLGVDETVQLGLALGRALGAAHERGIVHRDVKPENVLFTASGRPLLTDLGLAKHFDKDANGASRSIGLTRHGALAGTAGYMAPEQLEDARSAGPPADVFALGAVLYECLAGRPAFQGDDVVHLMARVSSGIVEPIGRASVPAWLERVIMTALSRDPRKRFATGTALASALERGRPALAKEAAPRRRFVPIAAGGVLGVLLLAGVLVLASHPSPPEVPSKPVEPAAPKTAPALPRELTAVELVARADERRAAGDAKAAIADATRAIELAPRLATAWLARGVARGVASDWAGELADTTRAIELDPKLAQAWGERGSARIKLRDLDGAIADETRALELEPGRVEALCNRGTARGEAGDLEGKIEDLTRAIELAPRLAVPWTERGIALAWKGDWDGSIADLTQALALDPGLARAWMARGLAHNWKHDFQGAIADETRAIELDPAVAQAWKERGVARAQLGDFEGTIADATKALELDPSLALVWRDRAYARLRRDDVTGAIADLERSLELSPADPGADDARSALAGARKRAGH